MALLDHSEYQLPVTERGVVRLTPELREFHLSEGVRSSIVQATGDSVDVWLWSERGDVRVEVPTRGFLTSDAFERTLNRWGVNLSRYIHDEPPTIDVRSEADDRFVNASVVTHDAEVPF